MEKEKREKKIENFRLRKKISFDLVIHKRGLPFSCNIKPIHQY